MTSVADLKMKAADLRKTLAQIDKLTGTTAERDRTAMRQRERRSSEKIVLIPRCADRARRERLEADDAAWLRWYFDDCGYYTEAVFWYDFTEQQQEMISAIGVAVLEGGDQSLAASRGEGKTTLARRLTLKYTLQGKLSFSVLFNATGGQAEDSLESIKRDIECNERLCADYPEVCIPVRDLSGAPQRAHSQIVSGERHDNGQPYECAASRFAWCGQQISFPNVPGSPSSRAIIATRGLDAAVVGLNKIGARPQLAILDDVDTDDTVYSADQARKLETRIDRSIGGLGGQRRRCARVMLCTIRSRNSCAFRYTDIAQKSSFKGKRMRYLVVPPNRLDLWERYVELQSEDWRIEAETKLPSTVAHELYVANREAMDAGAVVANVNRYMQGELSALQSYYSELARKGPDYCATELNNDPPIEDEPQESGIHPRLVASRLSGYEVRVIPAGTIGLTAGIDLRKPECHWVVIAWQPGALGVVVERGRQTVDYLKESGDSKEGKPLEQAIVAALHKWREHIEAEPYTLDDGEIRKLDAVWIDSGYQDMCVWQFVREVGGMPYWGCKGFGKSRKGMSPFSQGQASNTLGHRRKIGEHMFLAEQANLMWLYGFDADYWKRWVHQRFLTPTRDEQGNLRPGSLSIYGTHYTDEDRRRNEREQIAYANHICSEVETKITLPNKAVEMKWIPKGRNNHWLDATAMACAAGWSVGVRLLAGEAALTDAPKRSALINPGMSRDGGRRW